MTRHAVTNLIFAIALLSLFLLGRMQVVSWLWFLLLVLLYFFVIALGSYFIDLNFFTYSYCRGDESKPSIAITFDDGPNSSTDRILDILKEEKVPATFFCIGKNIAGNEAILLRIDREGHVIGTHSFNHHWSFPLIGKSKIAAEIRQAQDAVEAVIHKKPLLFRPPFGVTDPPIANAITQTGVKSIGWSLRSYDTVIDSSDKLMKRLHHIKNGDIVLFHEAGLQTNIVLPLFIKYIRSQGFEIVPLQQISGISPYGK